MPDSADPPSAQIRHGGSRVMSSSVGQSTVRTYVITWPEASTTRTMVYGMVPYGTNDDIQYH